MHGDPGDNLKLRRGLGQTFLPPAVAGAQDRREVPQAERDLIIKRRRHPKFLENYAAL